MFWKTIGKLTIISALGMSLVASLMFYVQEAEEKNTLFPYNGWALYIIGILFALAVMTLKSYLSDD
jgi:uncharacterized membrane protein